MSNAIALEDLRFDDLKVGDCFVLGNYEMTRADIMDFASKYDPQPWHLDEEAAAANPVFGRLSASGWHTTVVMSLLMDRFWKRTRVRGLAGGGVDGVRWNAPVFVGDVLTAQAEVTLARVSASKPDRGILATHIRLLNQEGRQVAECVLTGIMSRD